MRTLAALIFCRKRTRRSAAREHGDRAFPVFCYANPGKKELEPLARADTFNHDSSTLQFIGQPAIRRPQALFTGQSHPTGITHVALSFVFIACCMSNTDV